MSLEIDWLNIDTADPPRLAKFWTEALGYDVLYSRTDGDERAVLIGGQGRPRILFFEVHDEKVVKNRLHLDLRPGDQDAEVERLLSLGATKVDIGQDDPSWVVMADPDGNEFCILSTGSPEEKEERRNW